jgi:ADP-ribosyl-[dinitrogen reductase] hydrolase
MSGQGTIKTSISHPLEVYGVAAGNGRVGMCMCPGKRQPHAATGPWERDLALDMDAVKAFGAAILVTLMEMHELDKAVPVTDLAAAATARGVDWLHLPIVDFGAPDDAFERAWLTHGKTLRDALKAGKNVVVHCRGGRGRSGLLAARILVELGEDPEAAIKAVRASNPLAIETPVQEEHIKNACRRGPI